MQPPGMLRGACQDCCTGTFLRSMCQGCKCHGVCCTLGCRLMLAPDAAGCQTSHDFQDTAKDSTLPRIARKHDLQLADELDHLQYNGIVAGRGQSLRLIRPTRRSSRDMAANVVASWE